MEVLALYFVEKNSSERIGKTGSKGLQNLVENSPQMTLYIESGKLAIGALSELPVDPYGRPPTVRNPTVGATVDRPGRPSTWNRESILCRLTRAVDRDFQRASSLERSTGTVGRPPVHKGVHVCARPVDRTVDPTLVRSTARSTEMA